MATMGLRDLRQDASAIVRRAEAGERITITVSGRPVAEIGPAASPRRWRRTADIAAIFTGPADEQWAQDREGFDESLRDPFLDSDLPEGLGDLPCLPRDRSLGPFSTRAF